MEPAKSFVVVVIEVDGVRAKWLPSGDGIIKLLARRCRLGVAEEAAVVVLVLAAMVAFRPVVVVVVIIKLGGASKDRLLKLFPPPPAGTLLTESPGSSRLVKELGDGMGEGGSNKEAAALTIAFLVWTGEGDADGFRWNMILLVRIGVVVLLLRAGVLVVVLVVGPAELVLVVAETTGTAGALVVLLLLLLLLRVLPKGSVSTDDDTENGTDNGEDDIGGDCGLVGRGRAEVDGDTTVRGSLSSSLTSLAFGPSASLTSSATLHRDDMMRELGVV
jgi:hypothetical protein